MFSLILFLSLSILSAITLAFFESCAWVILQTVQNTRFFLAKISKISNRTEQEAQQAMNRSKHYPRAFVRKRSNFSRDMPFTYTKI